ncbi:hypothetical protein M4951_03400 [Blastopirellula sp. J2-11]|uniref:ribbon-helix-helix domain-containing protein n=1 Tax=Blastopirellula sp. J2-11 TaxID=2943192 RepID=UPI0021C8A1F3|nr:hypothetical protein [Blastopirellula sp. J2-11]UUO07361.1 hypothetical protein M4951_03400 [Blastopirellula sp. J2-11]
MTREKQAWQAPQLARRYKIKSEQRISIFTQSEADLIDLQMAYIDNKCWQDERGFMMANTLNLSLTDELRAFIDENCGDGTLYATPSEFVRDLLRERKSQMDAARVRDAIQAGLSDAKAGRVKPARKAIKKLAKKYGISDTEP